MSFKEYARGKQIIFEYFNKDRSLDVWFDVVQLEKVIYNLLSNAFKYTPLGGTVSLSVQEYENSVMILISDTGIGIAEENLNKIFDRFYQVDSLDNQKGTGIGLALAKSIIEAHKGKIGARSREGKGTTFVVELPLGDSHISVSQKVETPDIDSYCISLLKMDDEKITEEIPEDENSDRTEEPSSKILIVEDNEEFISYLTRVIGQRYHIHTAGNGEEALKSLENLKPDIIISDVMMPVMDGIELCKRIKSDINLSHIPVILLTARTDTASKIAGLENGADVYIEKPVSVSYLYAQMVSLLENRNKLRCLFSEKPFTPINTLTETQADEKWFNRLNEIIQENISNTEFSVDQLTRSVNMSRTLLYAKVKAVTGLTPNEFIRLVRLRKAAEYLAGNEYKINEICYMVGFNSPSYFAKCFQNQFGVLPKDFINNTN